MEKISGLTIARKKYSGNNGKAKNAAEKDLAAKLVSNVHGVKKVVNNMTVE